MSRPLGPADWLGVLVQTALGLGLLLAVAVLPVGRWDWVAGWVWIAAWTVTQSVSRFVVYQRNPETLRARMRLDRGTPAWDAAVLTVMAVAASGTCAVAGLQARLEGTTPSAAGFAVGFALLLAGQALSTWALVENSHFERTVRVQESHRVIDTGPYALVRHPGYAALGVAWLGSPLMLGSWWAAVPALCLVVVLGVRAVLEERLLRRELPGYEDYARRVTARFLPGVW